jgi:hypothetical protein
MRHIERSRISVTHHDHTHQLIHPRIIILCIVIGGQDEGRNAAEPGNKESNDLVLLSMMFTHRHLVLYLVSVQEMQ